MSKARLDLPEPETPVTTVMAFSGTRTSMPFRLCSRAPTTTIAHGSMMCVGPRAMRARAAADAAAVEEDGILHLRSALDHHPATEHAVDHDPTADDGAVGHERVERLSGAAGRVGHHLGGTEAARDGSHGPGGVVEVECGSRSAEIHLRVVVGLERGWIVPVGARALRAPGQAGLEHVVGHHAEGVRERLEGARVVLPAVGGYDVEECVE